MLLSCETDGERVLFCHDTQKDIGGSDKMILSGCIENYSTVTLLSWSRMGIAGCCCLDFQPSQTNRSIDFHHIFPEKEIINFNFNFRHRFRSDVVRTPERNKLHDELRLWIFFRH